MHSIHRAHQYKRIVFKAAGRSHSNKHIPQDILQQQHPPTPTPLHSLSCTEIFEGSTPQQLVAALQGRRLLAAGRKGKNLWLQLDGEGPMPLMHFGES
jgi:hypothetical protein